MLQTEYHVANAANYHANKKEATQGAVKLALASFEFVGHVLQMLIVVHIFFPCHKFVIAVVAVPNHKREVSDQVVKRDDPDPVEDAGEDDKRCLLDELIVSQQ